MKFRVAGIIPESYVDGIGIRFVVFVQGCHRHCKRCHNPFTWDFNGGHDETTEHIVAEYKKNPLLKGITFSGGEPFEQPLPLSLIAHEIHNLGGDVWTYTGYTLNELLNKAETNPDISKLLHSTDYLVDEPYLDDKRDLSLPFRGSSNQNIWIRHNDNYAKWSSETEFDCRKEALH